MEGTVTPVPREALLVRRRRLESAAVRTPSVEVARLLREVDAALQRMDFGTFGLCDTCGDPIEADRLIGDPLTRFCLDHLSAREQRALEQDLELAARIQRGLLPKVDRGVDGWTLAYHYQPAGLVSGDYCDVIQDNGNAYFFVGDVAGKGVAAAMLMSHLSALLRTLVSARLPLPELVERASRVFCESTLASHYATLVCGRASSTGEVEICNAGHPPPLVVRHDGAVEWIDATGLPIGMFADEQFVSRTLQLRDGDTLLLYTDGVVEARNAADEEYGLERFATFARAAPTATPEILIDRCGTELRVFTGGAAPADDVTIMAVRRAG
jgi:phosphoserine phosphatase RsbU/P